VVEWSKAEPNCKLVYQNDFLMFMTSDENIAGLGWPNFPCFGRETRSAGWVLLI
jgi:hypothetical protein